jgi:hypothetical protein
VRIALDELPGGGEADNAAADNGNVVVGHSISRDYGWFGGRIAVRPFAERHRGRSLQFFQFMAEFLFDAGDFGL